MRNSCACRKRVNCSSGPRFMASATGRPARKLRAGRVVVLDIDVKGAGQVRQALPDAVMVFVLPPSADALRQRLASRATEPPEERRVRLETARQELRAAGLFDYIIVNDDFET